MEEILLESYIFIALLLTVIILLITVLARQGKSRNPELSQKLDGVAEKTAGLSQTIGTEFERSRRETQSAQYNMRTETAKSLGEMNEKIEKLRLDNTEYQGRTEKTLSFFSNFNIDIKEMQPKRFPWFTINNLTSRYC